MTITYLKPKPKHLQAAFRDHKVHFVEHPHCSMGRSEWRYGLRAATCHHTAGKDSADYLADAWNLPGANTVINNGHYNGTEHDGRAVILSWGDCWHPGVGGPWAGVSGEDSLHLVSWGIEIESLGTRRDITDAQVDTVGRMLAALIDLGVPIDHVHRHADWTDATASVTGPLRKRKFDSGSVRTTTGRKIDTRKDLDYTTGFWQAAAAHYAFVDRTGVDHPATPVRGDLWDGYVPFLDVLLDAQHSTVASVATYRLAARLHDMGHYAGIPKLGVTAYPRKAVAHWQASRGYVATGNWGPKAQILAFGKAS